MLASPGVPHNLGDKCHACVCVSACAQVCVCVTGTNHSVNTDLHNFAPGQRRMSLPHCKSAGMLRKAVEGGLGRYL